MKLKIFFLATLITALLTGAEPLPPIVALYQGGNVTRDELQLYTAEQWVNHAPFLVNKPFPTDPDFTLFSLNNMLFNRLLKQKYGTDFEGEEYIDFFTHYYSAQFAHTLTSNRIYMEVQPDLNEESLLRYYHEYVELLKIPARVTFQYLMRNYNDDLPSFQKQSQRELIDELYGKITADPGSFGSLIKEYSEAQTPEEEGFVRNIDPSSLHPDFQAILLSLEEEAFSEPIQIQQGYYIIRLIEYQEAELQPFEEMKPFVRQLVADSQRNILFQQEKISIFNQYMEDWSSPEELDYDEDYHAPLFSFPRLNLDIALENLEWALGEHDLRKIMNRPVQRERFLRQIAENFAFYFHLLDDEEETILRARHILNEAVFRRYFISEYIGDLEVTAEETREYYEKYSENFMTGDQYLISQITVYHNSDPDKSESIITRAYQRLEEGNPFTEVASRYSEDTYRDKGGLVGWVSRPSNPRRDEIMVSLNNGEISSPVETDKGYLIVHRQDMRGPQLRLFEEVEKHIEEQLLFHKRVIAIHQLQEELFSQYKVKIVSSIQDAD